MPSDLFLKKINLDYLYPPFLERLLVLKVNCKTRGASYLTTYGYRSWGESHQLYQKHLNGGPRAAPAGYSSHNYGLASDEALILSPSPKRTVGFKKEDFRILGEEAAKLGLHWGIEYGDAPHISWPGFVKAKELEPLKRIWDTNNDLLLLPRLKKVWEYVEKYGPQLEPVRLS